jgi:LPS sulfotransferase NodH
VGDIRHTLTSHSWATAWRRLRHRLALALHWWLLPQTPFRPLFVIATHRSGSNLLIDLLNRVPGVYCLSEILCPTFDYGPSLRKRTPQRATSHIRRSLHATGKLPVRGAKFMLDQLRRFRVTPSVLTEAFPDARYVILYRQSLAEQYLSVQSALATQQWSLRDGETPRQVRIGIDPADFRHYCERIKRDYQDWLACASPERAILLSYEELTSDPQWWLNERICPLVALSTPPAIRSSLRKQSWQPLAERIANFDQVARLLQSPIARQSYTWPQGAGSARAA